MMSAFSTRLFNRIFGKGGKIRVSQLMLVLILTLLIGVTIAFAFAEEPLYFRDPYTGQTGSDWEEVSTIHDDLTYGLALAAGFSVTDSIRL